ncbi:nuclear pore membrane glycoprotein 210-like [Dorcoceras hygrometricum]|uniref:Nuclear pore membrane glycoprotein 210-like n=1 Tax=Dorcoceras hygrometricum TaxID=472368 RepID=A0A2Z7CKH0_9LAMI|nr:nuclear pore membrane glycoprotein 210-like [Dorcoceras hygrometricum]
MLPFSPLLLHALLLLLLHPPKSLSSSGPHIADVNILLPPKMTYPVEYRLQGSDGCFKWSWDHQDILSVLPEYNSSSRCSTSARLKSIAPYGGRKETAVYATDLNSGMVIRCKVYIDGISRIQIFHNSIKLDLDGLATLRVRAFDSEENVFSSLVGLQFSWRLMPEIDGFPHNLVHVPLKESPLSDCGGLCGDLEIQVKLEESGVYSDLFVVKGTGIGHEIVSVLLLEPSYMHLEDKLALTVAEAMSLDPTSPVFVIVGAVVNYNLKVIRNNSPHLVGLPSPFHQWSVLNSSVAQVEREMGKVHALDLGMTTVIVDDTRVVGHMQTSSLHVVLPDSLLLFLSPLSLHGDLSEGTRPIPSVSRWYVVSGRSYLIEVKVFSPGPGAQEIYVTESDDIELHDSNIEFWNTVPGSDSITTKPNYRILNANSIGLGRLTATLAYSTGHDMRKEVLKVVQEVMVCNQVKFMIKGESGSSDSLLLPWVPGVFQDLELEASGGCAMSSSDYKWFSSDVASVSVSASGSVQAKKPGRATIRAVSIFDPLNYDEVIVEVTLPSSMVMLPGFPAEASVGTYLQASVTLKAPSGSYFYACDAFRSLVKWKTESASFIIVNGTVDLVLPNKQEDVERKPSSLGPPCAWTLIYASHHGRSVVHATLTKENQHFDQSSMGPVVLKASSIIAAYLPLMVHQASDGNQFGGYWFDLVQAKLQNQLSNLDHLYLVPGTHMDIMLNGGPERWDQEIEYIETVEVLVEHQLHVKDRVVIYQMPTRNGNAYRIGCEGFGTFKLIFRRGNLVAKDHPLPAVAEVQLSLTCNFPSTILIIADEAFNAPQILQSAVQANRTPAGIRASPVTVANGRRIRISSVGISDSGKAFANSSSLNLRWELIGCQGMVLMDDSYSSLTSKSSWERFLILQNTSGLCTIRSTVVSFLDSMGHLDFTWMPETYMNNLTDSIQLQLVSSLRVSPEFSLLFFSLDARLNLSITGGSCFLDIMVNDTQIMEVIQQSPAYDCSHLMLAPKSLGSALVTVHDIGLVPPLVAASAVQVADIEWLKITTGEYISIMEGNLQSLHILAGVGDGWSFDYSQYIYMNIRVHIEDDMVELVEDYDYAFLGDGYVHAPNFTIRGTHLGVTNIYLSTVQHSGLEILSQPVKVEVYAPPNIHPRDIFLVPGASFVLTVRGGPKLGTHAQYVSMDSQVAEVHKSSGRLSAISLGNSTIVVTIYSTGDFLLCQAYSAVKVGIPSSAILNVQSEQLAVGRLTRVHSSLSEGNLFSYFGLCKNFNWTVEDKEILNFHVANHSPEVEHDGLKNIPSGSLNKQDGSFIQVMYGLSAGKTNVTVSFSCDIRLSNSLSKSVFYSASRLLWVVSDLPLALGSSMTWILPPHYTSSDLLPLFSHGYSKGDPQSDKVAIAYSLLGHYNGKTEEVQDAAIHIKGAKIITKGFDNLVCIQSKDRSTGRTEVASCVKVTEVAQIRIATDVFPVHTLPVGAQLDISIKYHDALGNPFHEAHNVTLFEAETNNPDVISINSSYHNGSIHLLAKNEGVALLKISFINNPQKSDYVLISVGPQLYPQNPVMHQGTSLSFGIQGISNSTSGRWFSGNASIVSVERRSGKAEAIGAGQTHVNFKSSNLKLSTLVTVLETNTVSIEPPKEVLTNVPFPVKGYAFSVKFSDAYADLHEAVENNVLSLFECAVDPPHIGFSKPWKDLDTGSLYCLFFPYSPEHLARSTPNLGGTGHHTSVSVRASLKGNHRISGSASAVFIGGFEVFEMDQHAFHLNMTRDSNKRVITIIGNTDVEINWRDRDRLSVRPIREGDAGEGKHVRYEVKVLGAKSFQDRLILSLPATGQSVEIKVSFEGEEREGMVKTAPVASWIGVVALFILLILTVTFLIYCLDRPDRYEPIVPSGAPGVAAPATPERSVRAGINDQSPRTPQPFIDYVRRTLDETPYYRQDFRRRINPQNTY